MGTNTVTDKMQFVDDLVRETTCSATPLGRFNCEMELFVNLETGEGNILWNYENIKNDDDSGEEVIGLWFDGMKVTDYDGVFELPEQAIALLQKNGFNTEEVE